MPSKTQSILLGAAVVGLLSTSYLAFINVLCCAGVILGAMAAVWHYTNEYGLTILPGQGAAMGALAAILGGLLAALLNYVLGLIGVPATEDIIQGLMQQFYTEEQQEMMREMQEQQASPLLTALSIGFGLMVSALFGALGGVIGAAVFKQGGEAPEEAF